MISFDRQDFAAMTFFRSLEYYLIRQIAAGYKNVNIALGNLKPDSLIIRNDQQIHPEAIMSEYSLTH